MNRHIHFIGIGGSGLSAIARLLKEKGAVVSGSDRTASHLTSELADSGIKVFIGHDPKNIMGADLVVRSSAVPDDNPEVSAALSKNIQVLKRSDFIDQLMPDQDCIAVAGTHGKTTTTSMITWILVSLGKDPSFIIGGISRDLGTNAHSGKGSNFVIEADEYDHMFLGLKPKFAVITNIEHDHPDCYPTVESYFSAFAVFANQVKPDGVLLVDRDDKGIQKLIDSGLGVKPILTYSLQPGSDYWPVSIKINDRGGSDFTLWHKSNSGQNVELADLSIQVPGRHNVANATAAMGVAHKIGLSMSESARALGSFTGAGRRFEVVGEGHGMTVIDDYAHHPTEIRATLQAARDRFPSRRLWVVWQPHTYSRIQTLYNDFITAFQVADRVIVTEIFAAREKNLSFSARQIAEQMDHPNACFAPTFNDATSILFHEMMPGDVLLVLSAGDAIQVSAAVVSHFKMLGKEVGNV